MSNDSVSPESFELTLFWVEHKKKILIYTAIVVAALAGYGISELIAQKRERTSAALFANAKTVADYQVIIQKYSGSHIAGNAILLAAEKLRAEKKYDEAEKMLRDFTAKYPEHPLVSGAWASLAATLECQNKLDEALETYQQLATRYPDTYTTPIAMIGQARIYALKGKKEDARRTYQDAAAAFGDSLYAREAMRELQFLKN